jgi:hypothetical protein
VADQRPRCEHLNRLASFPAWRIGLMRITVESMVRRALIGIATVGILAVTVGVETANAQPYRRYGAARTYTWPPYTPQSRGSVRREGVPRNVPFSDPNSPEATGGGSLGYNQSVLIQR